MFLKGLKKEFMGHNFDHIAVKLLRQPILEKYFSECKIDLHLVVKIKLQNLKPFVKMDCV